MTDRRTGPPAVYSVDTLAERWSCSPDAIRMMINKGTLPAFRVGKLIRVTAVAVAEYERNAFNPPPDEAAVAAAADETERRDRAIRLARLRRIVSP